MPLLEVTGLTGGYGVTDILHDVSFAVEQGGITTILGANGAGKTSVLRALCGMLRVSDAECCACLMDRYVLPSRS
jgi:branched-chain amino acid transport system ATP-binding protein